MRIELVYDPGCPNAGCARERLRAAMRALGVSDRFLVERVDAARPSPSVLIDGVDVMGTPPESARACRLDLPSEHHLLAALTTTDTAFPQEQT